MVDEHVCSWVGNIAVAARLRARASQILRQGCQRGDKMDAYIGYLRSKDVRTIPHRVRGRVFSAYEEVYNSIYVDAESGREVYAGLKPTSCTSTVAALMLWLCGAEQTLSEEPREGRHPL
jgi:hypothetical protein